MQSIAKTLGGRLKDLREEKGMTQDYVADQLGVSQAVIARYETDIIKRPKQEHLEQFARLYGSSVDYLTTNPYNMDHIPSEIKKMLHDKDCLPFLAEAYVQYQQLKARQAMQKFLK